MRVDDGIVRKCVPLLALFPGLTPPLPLGRGRRQEAGGPGWFMSGLDLDEDVSVLHEGWKHMAHLGEEQLWGSRRLK